MIVRMAKVEIVGAKELLQDTLALLRELGVFHVEPAAVGFVEEHLIENIRSFCLDEKTARERALLQDIAARIDELFACLPAVKGRTTYVDPATIIPTLARTIDRHTAAIRECCARRDALRKEREELERQTVFLGSLSKLLQSAREAPDLEFIGLTIREPGMVGALRDAVSRITDWKYELHTETAPDGSLVGLITVEKESADRVRKALTDERVPELQFPPSVADLTFREKIAYVRNRIAEISRDIEGATKSIEQFAHRWGPLYRAVRDWIDDRLALLRTTASAFETRLCFFINGWMPARDVPMLAGRLRERFGTRVIVDEQEIRDEDLERVPIVLRNPAYFRPFELFTRLLPLPAYTSYDPTPFIGVFFPVFFGMILGDAGYGLLLAGLSLVLQKRFRSNRIVTDAGRILFVSSLYAVIFGVLYGEFFGELPHALFGIEPLWVDRRTGVLAMTFFALAVGIAHVLIGLLLGVLSAFRTKRREALYKLVSVVLIVGLVAAGASLYGFLPAELSRSLVIAILILTPLLFVTGGLLAPIEFLKSIGNIISYVRIMAIGLTSVLLAYVANQLAGLAANVFVGIIVAGLLHALNIVLGVFAPTIHSLRLHYVEFFSKFIEHGGRRFEPLSKGK